MATKGKRRQPSTAMVRASDKHAKRIARVLDAPDSPGVLGVFERMARDPKLTVEKLGELIRLQREIMDTEAKAAFEAAYARMKPEIPAIEKRGIIRNKEGKIQSRYSKYEDIRDVVDPILLRHGFHTHNATEWPETGTLEVVSYLTHDRGHSRESRFRTTADASGGKNAIQGLGSGVSYGKRYTLIDLLAIVCKGQDDDGQAHGRAEQRREAPAPVHGKASEPITLAMRDKIVKLVGKVGRDPQEVKRWLDDQYGYGSTAEITRDRYDEIIAAIEAPGLLPGVLL